MWHSNFQAWVSFYGILKVPISECVSLLLDSIVGLTRGLLPSDLQPGLRATQGVS